MFKLRRNKKGFTMIELIVVIAIIAILAAIAIPSFIGITQTAQDRVDLANAKMICSAINAYNTMNPNDTIASKGTWADAKTKVTDELWPKNIGTDTDVDNAWALVTITAGVATASEAAPATS